MRVKLCCLSKSKPKLGRAFLEEEQVRGEGELRGADDGVEVAIGEEFYAELNSARVDAA